MQRDKNCVQISPLWGPKRTHEKQGNGKVVRLRSSNGASKQLKHNAVSVELFIQHNGN